MEKNKAQHVKTYLFTVVDANYKFHFVLLLRLIKRVLIYVPLASQTQIGRSRLDPGNVNGHP